MSVSCLRIFGLIAACLTISGALESRATDISINTKTYVIAQGTGLRLPISNRPTYPGTAGIPSVNINDARPAFNAPLPSGSPAQILQQNFPVPVKGSDADTFMPAGLLEKSLGPLSAPRKETHIY